MKFNKQHRPYLVGAQFIGAPPIYRPGERIDGPLADKEFFQSKRGITPIGTRASPAFCRDKGRMRRWVGVWCLSSCMAIPPGFPADPLEHLTRTRTSTRPPHPPHPTPCPYRTAYVYCCIRSAKFIIGTVHEVLIRASLRHPTGGRSSSSMGIITCSQKAAL